MRVHVYVHSIKFKQPIYFCEDIMDQYAVYVYLSYGISFTMLGLLSAKVASDYFKARKKFDEASNMLGTTDEA